MSALGTQEVKKYACRGEERLHNMACFPEDLGMSKSSSLDYKGEGGRKCWAEVHQHVGYTIWLGCQACKRPLNEKLESMEGRVDQHPWGGHQILHIPKKIRPGPGKHI